MNNTAVIATKGSSRREVEIRVRIPAGQGGPTAVLTLVLNHGLAALARSYIGDRDGMTLLLTTNQPGAVQQVLEAAGYACRRTPPRVVLSPTFSIPAQPPCWSRN
jgi:hypothetical protein